MYNTRKNTKIFWIGFIVVTILSLFIFGKYDNDRRSQFYKDFNKANINDIIVKVDKYARGKEIIFNNKRVIFYPITSPLNKNKVFSSVAETGDRVVKPAYGDTLILVRKNGEILKYTFQKPNEE